MDLMVGFVLNETSSGYPFLDIAALMDLLACHNIVLFALLSTRPHPVLHNPHPSPSLWYFSVSLAFHLVLISPVFCVCPK